MREVDESERYLGTKVDNMWWMNRCDMEVGQGNMPHTHVIQNIHINNLEKLSRGHITHKLGNTRAIRFSRKDCKFLEKKQKCSVDRLAQKF